MSAEGDPRLPVVTVYGRAGCHLCEEAMTVVHRVRDRVAFELRTRDIDSDDALFTAYLERIPVVAIDDHEAFELFVDAAELEAAVRKVGPAGVPR